jgi:hypothetical protein
VAPGTAVTRLSSRGGPPKAIFLLEGPAEAAVPATQNGLTDLPDRTTSHDSQSYDINGRKCRPETKGTCSVTESRLGVHSPR